MVQGTAHLLEINDVDLLCAELSDMAIAVLTPDRHIHAIAGGLDIQGEGLGLPLDIALEVEDHLSFQCWSEEDCNGKPGERRLFLLCSLSLSFLGPILPALCESGCAMAVMRPQAWEKPGTALCPSRAFHYGASPGEHCLGYDDPMQ